MAPTIDDRLSNIISLAIIGCMLLFIISMFTYVGILVRRRYFSPASSRGSESFRERIRRFFSELRPVRRRRQAANDVEELANAGPPHGSSNENLPEYHVADPRPPILPPLPPLYGTWSQPLPQPPPQAHSVARPDGRGQRAQCPLHAPQLPADPHPGERWDLGTWELSWWRN